VVPATPAEPAAKSAAATETKPTETPAPAATPEAKAADGTALTQGTPAEIVYDIKAPQGVDLDPEAVSSFVDFAKAEKIPAELAQKFVEYGVKHQAKMAEASEKALADQVLADEKAGFDELKKDPELGGSNYEQTLKLAAEGFQKFATKDEIAFMESTRLGNRVPMIKLFHRIALAFREDRGIGRGAANQPAGAGKSDEATLRELYPNSPELFGDKKTEN